MRFVSILALSVGCLALAAASPQNKILTAKQIYDKWSESVVTIKAGKKTGTGFFADDGRLFTAFHVIRGASRASVVFSDGKEVAVRGLTASDPAQDIAILTTEYYPGWESREKGPKLGDYAAVRVGDRVVVIGSPLGLSGSITEGLASGKRDDGAVSLLQLSAGVSPGSSGSPVFNATGDVIGMVTGSLDAGQLLNFAVSSKDLKFAHSVPLWSLASEAQPRLGKLPTEERTGSLLLNPKPIPASQLTHLVSGLSAMPDTSILVESLPEALSGDLTTPDVELWVRSGLAGTGLRVVSRSEQSTSFMPKPAETEADALEREDRAARRLYVNIFAMKDKVDNTLYYFARIQVDRAGFVSPGRFESVTVWDRGRGGYAGRANRPEEVLRKAVDALVRDFVDAWKVANQGT